MSEITSDALSVKIDYAVHIYRFYALDSQAAQNEPSFVMRRLNYYHHSSNIPGHDEARLSITC